MSCVLNINTSVMTCYVNMDNNNIQTGNDEN
jgi:hypothetical protein